MKPFLTSQSKVELPLLLQYITLFCFLQSSLYYLGIISVTCLLPFMYFAFSRTPGVNTRWTGALAVQVTWTFNACGLALWESRCQDLLGEIYQRRTKGRKQEAGRTVRPQCRSEPQERRKGRKEDQLERISDLSTILRKFWAGPWEVLEPTFCILQEGVRNLTSAVLCQWQGSGAARAGGWPW